MARQSFFDFGEPEAQKKSGVKTGCSSCSLKSTPVKQELKQADILFVLESPTKKETSENIFDNSSCRWLFKHTDHLLCEYTYAVKCQCGTIKDTHIDACSLELQNDMQKVNPKIIIPMGSHAIKAVIKSKIKGRLRGLKYTDYIGEAIPLSDYYVYPTYSHTQIKQYKDKDINYEKEFIEQIKQVELLLKTPLVAYDKKWNTEVEQLTDAGKIAEAIYYFSQQEIMAFDYETTGIKPHAERQQLKTIGISDGKRTVSFPVITDCKESLKMLLECSVKKIAQKLDFEDMWSYYKLDANVNNWHWDTLLGARCLHNKKSGSLKFQVFTKFGIVYDDEVAGFLKATKEEEDKYGANAVNQIDKAPLDKILHYNGLDAFYTFKLYEYQKEKIKGKQLEAFKFLVDGATGLAHVQRKGLLVNETLMHETTKGFTKEIDLLYNKIRNHKEVKQWKDKQEFNPDSEKQLKKLLYDMIGLKSQSGTTDEKALSEMKHNLCDLILQYRKNKKMRDTYIAQIKREVCDGVLYPFFPLHTTQTYRSSSQNPNFQNQPKRGVDAYKIRQLILPHKGCKLVEYDYKAVEVAIGSCYHKDEKMISYVTDSSNDMHRDTACDIFIKEPDEITKWERQTAKNKMVFPSFYGSTSKNTAPAIWEELQDKPEIKQHLKEHDIKNFNQFETHIKKVESIFWNKRFKHYNKWKRDIWNTYQKDGVTTSHIGFTYQPYMAWTECTNYQIQGTAFHCLLYTLKEVQKKIDSGMFTKSCIVGQIHDSLVCSVHPDEEKKFDRLVKYIATKKIRESFQWILVPLTIEKEAGEVDQPWNTLKEVEF